MVLGHNMLLIVRLFEAQPMVVCLLVTGVMGGGVETRVMRGDIVNRCHTLTMPLPSGQGVCPQNTVLATPWMEAGRAGGRGDMITLPSLMLCSSPEGFFF